MLQTMHPEALWDISGGLMPSVNIALFRLLATKIVVKVSVETASDRKDRALAAAPM